MTWLKLDDSFASHPKVIGLSDGAFRLHVAALCYCGQHLTDGHLLLNTKDRLPAKGTAKMVLELEEAGLWLLVNDGWQMKDFLLYNPSREQVEARRVVRAEAGRKGGQISKRSSKRQANTSTGLEPRPDPKGLGTESVLTVSGGEGVSSDASPCPRCEGMGWVEAEGGRVTPCPHTYLKAVSE